jgi:hypothetical membrane protein
MLSAKKIMWMRMTGLLGIITPFFIFLGIFAAISISPWFSWERNALSDLGVSQNAGALFNTVLILGGIFVLLLGSGMYLALTGAATSAGAVMLILAAISLTAIGIFPENLEPHIYVSVAFFALLPLSQLTIGMSLMRDLDKRSLGMVSVSVAIASAFVWSFPTEGVAIPEALASALGAFWSVVFGFKLYKQEI